MFDNIPIGSLVDSGTTIALLVVLLFLGVTDRIVSGKRLRDEREIATLRVAEERNAKLEERADKKEYAEIVRTYGATLEKLLAGTETTNQLLRSLPHPTDKDH